MGNLKNIELQLYHSVDLSRRATAGILIKSHPHLTIVFSQPLFVWEGMTRRTAARETIGTANVTIF